jgi:hypothetical protein
LESGSSDTGISESLTINLKLKTRREKIACRPDRKAAGYEGSD